MEQNKNQHNGRVSDADKVSNYRKSEEEIIYNNQRDDALKGILERTKLSNIFLSPENTKNIQKQIRYGVHQESGKVISEQSHQEVSTVMRSIYLQEGSVPVTSDQEALQVISKLNANVIDYCVNNVVAELKQNDMYIKDISSLPVPIDRPQFEKKNMTYDMSNIL
jgi:CRISPR/Cas system CSM-associated protein Csm4 (group 5 of RAMP superfamily)|tara:strand:- start:21 stop:515 length:495 start_codon:yes stop_codon:yes gene_type:complete